MPIWTGKIGFLSQLNPKKVYFYLEHIREEKVRREIEELFASADLLLLLRNIESVTLHHLGLKIIRVKNGEKISLKKIQQGVQIDEQFYRLYEYPLTIPQAQRTYLSGLPPSECPEKLKIASKVNITFAVKLDTNGLPIPSKEARLYAYLPTDIRSDLPFWINTEFLLKQDRGQLLDNAWNLFLIEEIARLQFEVLRSIAQDPSSKHRVLRLLPVREIPNHQLSYFKAAYTTGFNKGFNEVAFIPSIGATLLRRHECVIDEAHFFDHHSGGGIQTAESKALFNSLFANPDTSYVIDHRLGATDTLKRILYPAPGLFSAQDLLAKLPEYIRLIQDKPKALTKLWSYLLKAEGELLNTLKTLPWLVLQSGRLQESSKCFLSANGTLDPDLNELDLINERSFPGEMRDGIRAWMIRCLGVAQITWVEVIKIHYPKLIAEKKVTKQSAIRMLWNVYCTYMNAADESIGIIRQLGEIFPIEIGKMTLTMNQCMIPSLLLEPGPPTQAYFLERIPNDYFSQFAYDGVALRALLILMGVRTELRFHYHPRLRVDQINKTPSLSQYMAYCQREYRQISHIFDTASHELEHFYDCDFMDKITLPGYQDIFWRLMVEHFATLSKASYVARLQGRISIVSPIVYSLKTYACLKAKNAQGLYSSNQLYTPALSQAYEAFPFPIADIPENIPNEIVQALGFKFALTFEEAMTLLENEPHLNPKKLQFLYRSLLSTYEKTSPTHQDRIEAFGKNKPFLSTQGTYKKHAEIYCWDMPGQPSTETYSFIDPCGLSLEDLQYLAQMFKLKLFSRDTLNTLTTLSLEQPQEAAKICQDLKLKVLHFLHIATISVAIDNGIHTANIDKIAKNFYDKLQGLTLTCWGDLCFALEHLSVSDSEFAKEKVVVKDHEILFTKQAYDNESVSLIDALANRMFDSEELKKLFAAYMDKPRRIRQQNLAMKNRSSADILAQAEAFFSSRASVYSQNISQSHSLAPEAQPLASAFAGFSITPRQTEPLADTGQARRREGIGELPTLWNVSRPYAPAPLTVDQPAGSSMKDIEKTAKNINTGQQGELRFYQYLQEQTQKMFPSSQAEETAEGYAVYDSNHRPIINIIWFNKNGEQRKAMDFQVDYQGQSYIFEVKTTQGQDMHAFISSSEVKKLDEYKDNYALVFVFGDGNIHIRWNPSQKISNRILELIPTQYQLFIDTSHDLEWAREEQHKDKGCRMS